MRLTLLVAAAVAAECVAALTFPAFAQIADVIKARKAGFKVMETARKPIKPMLQGVLAFDLKVVQAVLATIVEQSAKQKDLFGDDTKTGDTDALPIVWEKKADFLARFDKLSADAKAAQASIKDEATFKAEWGKVNSNCAGCHKVYQKRS